MDVVTPDYFAALGIPVLRGRAFTGADREGAPPVVIVSESAARAYWPGDDPIGKRLLMGSGLRETATVVGVVPDMRYRDLREARGSIYYPLHQSIFPFAPTTLAIRTTERPTDVMGAIRNVLRTADPAVAVVNIAPFETFLDRPLAQPRLNALLLGVFAAAAVILAAVGLFGVIATMVRQRTRELGVRMALGATPTNVWAMVMERGLLLAATGTGTGLVAALVTNRLLKAMLYDVSPTDAVTLSLVSGLVLAVAMLATGIPARSSTRIDPAAALRAEG